MNTIKQGVNKFYIGDSPENVLAEIIYTPTSDNRLVIERTFVSDTLQGQGIGRKLVNEIIDLARRENKKISARCSYAHKMLLRCEDCQDLFVAEPDDQPDPFE
ncbi:MAG: GNAT family N-acetyltransferase [Saccharofermentanales bacterium]|jgi:predicted GNAT family acetyltransferase